jgi:hypothetical protein
MEAVVPWQQNGASASHTMQSDVERLDWQVDLEEIACRNIGQKGCHQIRGQDADPGTGHCSLQTFSTRNSLLGIIRQGFHVGFYK